MAAVTIAGVNINEITAALDSEIARLQQARAIIAEIDAPVVAARHRDALKEVRQMFVPPHLILLLPSHRRSASR